MTYYIKNGNSYSITSKEDLDIHEELPVGNYTIKVNPMSGQFYLERIDSFEAPSKIYGKTLTQTDRILNTFMDRPASTGVMLAGEKGSGKTLLAKMLSITGAERGIPSIIINAPYNGDQFNSFIQTIDQPTIIVFDEFEKVYDGEQQEAILTLLDGVFPSKKLFVLTCNDKWRVDSHMRNRPGRIYYMLDFKGLDADFVEEYCTDNLKNKEYIEKVGKVASLFSAFNFDMLKALVEEMNRYNETPQEALTMLNSKPEYGDGCRYDVTLITAEGVRIDDNDLEDTVWRGNPLHGNVVLHWSETVYDEDGDEESCDYHHVRVSAQELVEINSKSGEFTFRAANGIQVKLTKQIEKTYDYYGAF